MIRAAGILILDTNDNALFLKRGAGGDMPGMWCFPGGRLEDGETSIDAAVRETKEETGFDVIRKGLVEWTRSLSPEMTTGAVPTPPKNEAQSITEKLDAEMQAATASPVSPAVIGTEQVDFTTFVATKVEQFIPTLNGEHVAYAWAPIDQPPEPLHPGCRIALDRFNLDELGIARAISTNALTSPQKYENLWLYAVRITGTGASYRAEHSEYVIRNPAIYLNDEFLARCNGLPVIIEHPKNAAMLDSKEFDRRIVGAIMLAYIKGDEVWGIARIYDDETAELMRTNQLSTSPMAVWRNPSANEKMILEDGDKLFIEGKPSLLDHLAICPLGVWDKGGKPSGVTSIEARGDSVMPVTLKRIEGETDEGYAARVAEVQSHLNARADSAKGMEDILGGIKALTKVVETVTGNIDGLTKRLDSVESGRRSDARRRADAFEFPKRSDGESDKEFNKRMDAAEEKLRADMEDAGDPKETAADGARRRRDAAMEEKEKKADSEEEDKDKKKADSEEEDKDKKKADSEEEEDKRSDANSEVIADLRAKLANLEKMIPRAQNLEDTAKFASIQARADAARAQFGERAEPPLSGEDLDAYRRRMLLPLQKHHPDWAKANLLVTAADSAMLDMAENQIYTAAAEAARMPQPGQTGLVEVQGQTRAGHKMSKFNGDPRFWMSRHMPAGTTVTRINQVKGSDTRH